MTPGILCVPNLQPSAARGSRQPRLPSILPFRWQALYSVSTDHSPFSVVPSPTRGPCVGESGVGGCVAIYPTLSTRQGRRHLSFQCTCRAQGTGKATYVLGVVSTCVSTQYPSGQGRCVFSLSFFFLHLCGYREVRRYYARLLKAPRYVDTVLRRVLPHHVGTTLWKVGRVSWVSEARRQVGRARRDLTSNITVKYLSCCTKPCTYVDRQRPWLRTFTALNIALPTWLPTLRSWRDTCLPTYLPEAVSALCIPTGPSWSRIACARLLSPTPIKSQVQLLNSKNPIYTAREGQAQVQAQAQAQAPVPLCAATLQPLTFRDACFLDVSR